MRECQEKDLQDALPLMARGMLAASEAARVRAHVATCAACAEELALLERAGRLFDTATPRVDVAAIVAKLPEPVQRPKLELVRATPRRAVPRYIWAAAASLTLVATLSFPALKDRVFGGSRGTTPDSGVLRIASVPVGLVGGAELSDLGSTELEFLLDELDRMELTVAAEPVAMQRSVLDTPEDL